MRQSIYRGGPESRPLPDAYKQGIYKRTGDWATANKNPDARADAAYNAARLFNFIDSKNAHAVVASQHNDGFLSGYSGNEQVLRHEQSGLPFRGQSIRKDSEHALLKKFIEHGYSSLEFKGEQQVYVRPTFARGHPLGDQRSAEDIFRDNPLLAVAEYSVNEFVKFGDALEDLQKETGDWSKKKKNKNPEARADAAYNLAYLANYIDNLNTPTTEVNLQSPSFNKAMVSFSGKHVNKSYLLHTILSFGYQELLHSTE